MWLLSMYVGDEEGGSEVRGKEACLHFRTYCQIVFCCICYVYDAVYAMYVMLCSSPRLTRVYHQHKRLLVWLCKNDYD